MRRKRFTIVGALIAMALAAVLGVGLAEAQQSRQDKPTIEFLDGPKSFCQDPEEMLTDSVSTFDDGTKGEATAEQAIEAFEAEVRLDGAVVGDPELRELLAPTRAFRTTERGIASDGTTYYADSVSRDGLYLDARLVAVKLDGGWVVEREIRCMSTFTTDLAALRAVKGDDS